MPVSRNFSLPASIEGRKKIRPDSLARCTSEVANTCNQTKPSELLLKKVTRPNFLPTTNSNNNNDVTIDDPGPKDDSNKTVIESIESKDAIMGVDTTTTRGGTLSQPCLPVSTTIGATRIFPHLYLGSQRDVVDEEMMRTNGITYVLNVSKRCKQPNFIDHSHFHRISVRDNYQEKMTPYMLEAIEFIEKVRRSNQRVLVHCLAGVSRSATMAIAYVLHYLRIGFEDAYRFVKEKRPSISPNFNFLGQLMEFERALRESGHMDTKRTGSLSGAGEEEIEFICKNEDSEMQHSNIWNKNPECSPLSMPATCSYLCTNSPDSEMIFRENVPTSSFCRRRNGPTLPKFCFSTRSKNTPKGICDTTIPGHLDATPKNELFVDVCVAVPPIPRNNETSRRLGSDGNEMEEESTPVSVMCIPSITGKRNNDDIKFLKPQTAPSTPVIGRPLNGKSGFWLSLPNPKVAPRHRRCVSGGEITGICFPSLNMKRRFDSRSIDDVRKENASNDESMEVDFCSGLKRGASFSGGSYYDYSEPFSKAPYKIVSFHSRSPKILRKSPNLTLNLRSIYSNGISRSSSKSETAHASQIKPRGHTLSDEPVPKFDCSHNLCAPSAEQLCFSDQTDKVNSRESYEGNDVTSMAIGSISLSSPNTEKDATPSFQEVKTRSPSSPGTGRVSNTQPTSDYNYACHKGIQTESSSRFLCRDSFEYASSDESRPFMLSAGCELKLRWRTKDRRRQSADSGYLSSSQTSSQSSSSFTSPISQQNVFEASESCHENLANAAMDKGGVMISKHNLPCHVEGAFVSNSSDDGTNSNTETEGRKNSPVGRRAGVEIMSCS